MKCMHIIIKYYIVAETDHQDIICCLLDIHTRSTQFQMRSATTANMQTYVPYLAGECINEMIQSESIVAAIKKNG